MKSSENSLFFKDIPTYLLSAEHPERPKSLLLKDFTEIMRALGYPRSVSMDNFRTPNFELVADALFWMVKRYDPDINVSDNIESEADRVDFLTGVAVVSATLYFEHAVVQSRPAAVLLMVLIVEYFAWF